MMRTTPILLLVLLSPVLMANTCSDDKSNPLEADEFSAVLDLTNRNDPGGDPIHIFAPGEDFPCCRVNPGDGIRNVTMTLKPGSRYTFRAGRNGINLKTISCQVRRDASSAHAFDVVWTEQDFWCELDGGWED